MPASQSTNSGVTMGARSVEAVVIPTEKATSPLQRNYIMLLETPPGQQTTKILPAVRKGFSPKTCESVYASNGIMVNCAHAPMKISSGRENRILKSLVVRVSPIVSMMMPKITEETSPLIHKKTSGT